MSFWLGLCLFRMVWGFPASPGQLTKKSTNFAKQIYEMCSKLPLGLTWHRRVNFVALDPSNNNKKLSTQYLYGAHIQPSAAHGALHHIIPGHQTCSFMYHFNSLGNIQHCSHVTLATCCTTIAISVPPGTHLHLIEVKHLRIRTQHWHHNVPVFRGEKHDISLKILHLASLKLAPQAETLAILRALAIAPRPSLL